MKFFATIGILLTLALTACSASVSLPSAPDANNPDCAKVIVRLPQQTDNQNRRTTTSQSTAAWGEPTAITLTCGVDPVEVSQLACITAGGVDWLVDESAKPIYRFITFGRKPATIITIDSKKASGASVLDDLGQAVQFTKQTKKCLG